MTTQEMRITDSELGIIKSTFGDNDALLKLMRKVFLPEVDITAPVGNQVDLYMSLKNEGTLEQQLINLSARNALIAHIEMCLLQLKLLAGKKEESVEDTKERLKKDSSK